MTNTNSEFIALGFLSKEKIKQSRNRSVTYPMFFLFNEKNTFT